MRSIIIEGEKKEFAQDVSCGDALKSVLSGKKFKSTLAARCGDAGPLLDLTTLIPDTCETLVPVTADSQEGLELLRHSAAHVLAAAVRRLFPGVKVTIGPAIENGFYSDFDYSRQFTPQDFPAIEAAMRKTLD